MKGAGLPEVLAGMTARVSLWYWDGSASAFDPERTFP
jgi:hypothetical protein